MRQAKMFKTRNIWSIKDTCYENFTPWTKIHWELKVNKECLVAGGEGGNGVTDDVSIFGSIQKCVYT